MAANRQEHGAAQEHPRPRSCWSAGQIIPPQAKIEPTTIGSSYISLALRGRQLTYDVPFLFRAPLFFGLFSSSFPPLNSLVKAARIRLKNPGLGSGFFLTRCLSLWRR